MEYGCSLLDGTECYSSAELGAKEIVLGRSKIEAGLDQGLRMLKPGGEAIFIIPPFLAYGLTGDGRKIPAKAVIVYNIKVLQGK
jgi:FKBP-type peptidyl-prolyl cis-trans isomerase